MKDEPNLDKKNLIRHIYQEYGIRIEELTFVPIGEIALSYSLKANDKAKYFLKMYGLNRLTECKLHTLDFSLNVAYQLNQELRINQVIYPIKTKNGLLKTRFDSKDVVLWSYVEGEMVTEKQSKTKEFMVKLGKLLAQIHQATNTLNVCEERFLDLDISFKNDLLTSLKEATLCVNSKDKNYNKLQGMIKPQMDNILQSLIYLEELVEKIKDKDIQDFVICHTDPIRHNTMIAKDGTIYLVDWDAAALAPFEQDIWFFLNDENLDELIRSYKEIRVINKIDEDYVAFLFYKRILDDLTDWIYRILFEEISQEQIESDFEGLEEDILPVLPVMKEFEEKLRKNVRKWVEI